MIIFILRRLSIVKRKQYLSTVYIDTQKRTPIQLTKSGLIPYLQNVSLNQLNQKDLAILSKKMLKYRTDSQLHWAYVLRELSRRLAQRSIQSRTSSTLLLNIAKSGVLRKLDKFRQLEMPVIYQLSNQKNIDPRHVTQYLAAFSRQLGSSQQFLIAIQGIIIKNQHKFNTRQLVCCLYSISNNKGRPYALLNMTITRFNKQPQNFNLNQICLLLRTQRFEQIQEIQTMHLIKHVLLRKNQCNAQDLTDLICYFCYKSQIGYQIFDTMDQLYQLLKNNIEPYQSIKIISSMMSNAFNQNLVPITLAQNVIRTLTIHRKNQKITDSQLAKLHKQARLLNNRQIRDKIRKLR